MYGVDLHRAIDSTGKEIQLGVTSVGLVVFQNNVRINVFSWSKMVKISFKRKDFFIQLRREPVNTYLLCLIKALYLSYFGRVKATIPYSVSAWARTRMLRLYGNRVSNITRSFDWNVRIVCQDFFHCRSVRSSTIPDAPNCKRSRRVNNEAKSRKCSNGHPANGWLLRRRATEPAMEVMERLRFLDWDWPKRIDLMITKLRRSNQKHFRGKHGSNKVTSKYCIE